MKIEPDGLARVIYDSDGAVQIGAAVSYSQIVQPALRDALAHSLAARILLEGLTRFEALLLPGGVGAAVVKQSGRVITLTVRDRDEHGLDLVRIDVRGFRS